jgi:hypothetical protein
MDWADQKKNDIVLRSAAEPSKAELQVIARDEKEIAQLFDAHPDSFLFRDLPEVKFEAGPSNRRRTRLPGTDETAVRGARTNSGSGLTVRASVQ